MSTKAKTGTELIGSAGGLQSEPGGRAEHPARGAQLSDKVIDQLLAGARSERRSSAPAACSPS